MKWRNSVNQYGWLAAGMHWIMLVLLVTVCASMELRGFFPKGSDPREGDVSRKPRNFRQPINMACLALGR